MIRINNIINDFKRSLKGKTARQTAILYSAQILALFLGIFSTVINTRILGPEGYGILAFFLTITSFTVLFFRFGFFSASGLLIAQAKGEREERELTGASIIAAFFIGVSYSFFILLLSFFVDDIFHTNIGWILRYASFILIVLPTSHLVYQIGRGTNKIEKLSSFNIIPKIVYIIGALMLLKIIQIEPVHFILLNVSSTFIGVIVVIYLFRPLFSSIRKNLKKIWKKTKEYGFHIYSGQIADESTYALDGIFITYFVTTTQLGFYSLANRITAPMVGLSNALSTSLFKRFVDVDRIPRKVIYYNSLWLAAGVAGLTIFGTFIVNFFFTENFLPAVPLILPLALAAFFRGMYQPYTFLAAKGKGEWIRNIAFAQASFNVVGNFVLIYMYGAMGAAIASAIACFIAYAFHVYYYRKWVKML